MFKIWATAATCFHREDKGTVAIIFALMSMALLMLGGIAIDYSRIVDMRGRVSSAIDTASLAAGKALLEGKLSDDEVVDLAKNYFRENVASANRFGTIGDPSVTVSRDTGAVNIDVDAKVAMTVTRIGGFREMTVPVTSSSVFQQRDIEVGMALDITGSMDEVVGGKHKIDALKTAFAQFADRLIPAQANPAQKVRIGVAPYSASINLGAFAAAASNNRSRDGCVNERKSGSYSDTSDPFYVKQDGVTGNYACPNSAIFPLSDDHDQLVAYVNGFSARGSTAGHLGVQWAWNLISDNWGGTWGGNSVPDSYARVAENKLLKAVVLMTDGQFNTQYHGSQSSQQAVALCTAMKAKGVVVFSVGFGLGGDPTALNTLKTCATPGVDYFADASSPEELESAFNKFAGKLSELRLAK